MQRTALGHILFGVAVVCVFLGFLMYVRFYLAYSKALRTNVKNSLVLSELADRQYERLVTGN